MQGVTHAIFRRGPAWMGGWEGKPDHDVCASLSGTASDLWVRNPQECTQLIAKRMEAWAIGAHCLGLLVLAYLCTGLAKEWIRRPQHTTIVLKTGQDGSIAVFEHPSFVTQRHALDPGIYTKEMSHTKVNT